MRQRLELQVGAYLRTHPWHGDLVRGAEGLSREVVVPTRSWDRWLDRAWIPASTRSAARSALRGLPALGNGRVRVGRELLAEWADAVAKDPSEHNLVRLWVAARIWSETTPRATFLGLTDRRLVPTLHDTAEALLADPRELATAYARFRLRCTPEFTAWFWAVGLAEPRRSPQPLILDRRVRATLRLAASRSGVEWPEPAGPDGYAAYVVLLDEVATRVGTSAENLEWLLIERGLEAEETFHAWLSRHAALGRKAR